MIDAGWSAIRGVGGTDVMSMPAVADWIMQSLVQGYLMSMVRAWLLVFSSCAPSNACERVMSCGVVLGCSTSDCHSCVQVWPKQVNIPFHHSEELEQWQAPLGKLD